MLSLRCSARLPGTGTAAAESRVGSDDRRVGRTPLHRAVAAALAGGGAGVRASARGGLGAAEVLIAIVRVTRGYDGNHDPIRNIDRAATRWHCGFHALRVPPTRRAGSARGAECASQLWKEVR